MANTVLAKMAVQISANTAEFNKKLSETSKEISSFTSGVKNMAVGLAAAFSIREVASFGLEVSKLAAEAEGVSSAFGKIKNSTILLADLRAATEGTVSDLKLMKLAVSAVNNNAPLKDLAEILNFVDRTADATGKNFEELADTIIKDIGKGSTKGLNDLGLSLDTIKKRTDEVGFLPAILEEVRRKSKDLGDITSVTADSYDRLGASLDNFKKAIGEFINQKGVSNILDKLSGFLSLWQPGVAQAAFDLKLLNTAVDRFNESQPEGKDFLDAYENLSKRAETAGKKLLLLTDEATGLRKVFIQSDPAIKTVGDSITDFGQTIPPVTQKVKNLEDRLDSLTRKKFLAPLEVGKVDSVEGKLVDPNFLKIDVKSIVKDLKVLPVEFRAVQEEMVEISGLIVGGIVDIASAFGEAAVTGASDFGRTFLRALGRFAQQFGGLLISIGVGEKALKFGGPGAKIAAGVALVALGGAISALMSNKPSMSGGGSSGSFGGALTPSSLFFQNGERQSIFLEARGASLVAVTNEQGRRDNRIRANSRRLS